MRPLQAHCHHGLGRLYRQTVRAEPARVALSAIGLPCHGHDSLATPGRSRSDAGGGGDEHFALR